MTGDSGSRPGSSAAPDFAAPDFAALYRELGLDAGCSPVELRTAWRRRVSKLHPDLGGTAEDTGRLQELNRLYDAAVAFHARFGRMPGAAPAGTAAVSIETATGAAQASGGADEEPWRRADAPPETHPAAGFGRISRSLVAAPLIAVVLIGVLVLGGRLAGREDDADIALETAPAPRPRVASAADTGEAGRATVATRAGAVADAIVPGMGKDAVRNILGEPLDMHAMRWHYGPSWVDFRCDRVADWYSSPLRPLPVAAERAPAVAGDAPDCR